MQSTMTKVLENLKNTAIGRCRERIQLASQKAKELMADEKCSLAKEREPCIIDNHGMTTAFKRRHGL